VQRFVKNAHPARRFRLFCVNFTQHFFSGAAARFFTFFFAFLLFFEISSFIFHKTGTPFSAFVSCCFGESML